MRHARPQWTALWLVALVALALWLRFHELTTQGMWSDELFSVSTITQVGAGQPWYTYVRKAFPDLRMEDSFLTWKASENSPPLFEALLWLWCQLFGWSDFAVRSFGALMGSLAPPVLFIGLRRPLGVWPAAAAALMFTLSPAAVAYSQEVRSYALLMLWATIAVVRLVQYALPAEGQRSHWWGSFKVDVAVYLLLSYTHYTGLVLACGLVGLRGLLALRLRRPLREFGWFAALPALLAPWLYLNWFAMAATRSGQFGWHDYSWAEVWSSLLPTAAWFLLVKPPYALPAALALALLGAGLGTWGRPPVTADAAPRPAHGLRGLLDLHGRLDLRWLLAWALMALVVAHFGYGIYTAFHARVWHARYFSAMVPVVLVVFALLFSLAWQARLALLARLLVLCTVLLACALSLPVLQEFYRYLWKVDYREASRYIAQNTRGRPTVAVTLIPNAVFYNYYLRGFMAAEGRSYTLAPLGYWKDLTAGVTALCQQARAPGEQVVLFQHESHRVYFDLINRHCAGALRLVSEHQFRLLIVDFYEATGVAPTPAPDPAPQ